MTRPVPSDIGSPIPHHVSARSTSDRTAPRNEDASVLSEGECDHRDRVAATIKALLDPL